MTTYDCLIGDSVVVHPDEEVHYVEKIVRISGTYLTFDGSQSAGAMRAGS
jgi:predicted O-linked N-acetylglucosamine transferase (SPINDLY family)